MRVVLIGDSIRMGYQPLVAAKCPGVEVWGPGRNFRSDFTRCLREDGCHMTEYGNEVLSDAVAQAIGALA